MSLSELEQQLLDYLKARGGEPASRDQLLRDVWGYADGVSSRTVDVTIQRLRKKIEPDPKAPRHIVTVRGKGYAYGVPGDGLTAAPSTAWPADSGPFVGRDAEVSAVADWVASGSRVLTLLGPVGVGKSRLMARMLSRVPRDTTHVVDLAGATTLAVLDGLAKTVELLALDHVENRGRHCGSGWSHGSARVRGCA